MINNNVFANRVHNKTFLLKHKRRNRMTNTRRLQAGQLAPSSSLFDNFPKNTLSTMIGFDNFFNAIDGASLRNNDNYPPYDIIRHSDHKYSITIAVAGFKDDQITITHEKNILQIDGVAKSAGDGDVAVHYEHKGIATRGFRRSFTLGDHVEVSDASLDAGMLTIDLIVNVPDEL